MPLVKSRGLVISIGAAGPWPSPGDAVTADAVARVDRAPSRWTSLADVARAAERERERRGEPDERAVARAAGRYGDEAAERLQEAERDAVDDVGERRDPRRHELQHVGLAHQPRLEPGDHQVEVHDPHEEPVDHTERDLERRRAGTKRFTSTWKTAPGAAPTEKWTTATSMKKLRSSVVSARAPRKKVP